MALRISRYLGVVSSTRTQRWYRPLDFARSITSLNLALASATVQLSVTAQPCNFSMPRQVRRLASAGGGTAWGAAHGYRQDTGSFGCPNALAQRRIGMVFSRLSDFTIFSVDVLYLMK
jgi:hypothetical protein